MKRGLAIAAAALVAVGLAAWLMRDTDEIATGTPLDGRPAATARDSSGSAAGSGVLPMPATRRAESRIASARPAPPPTLFGEFLGARQYRALYDRLQDTPEGRSAEGRLVLYEILRQCATITGGRRWNGRPAIPKREDFLSALAPGDPLRDKRVAAFDDFTVDRCAGFDGVTLTQADLARLLNEAAAAGDPRARALSIEQELWQSRRTAGDDRATPSDAQIESLKQAAGTRDPEAIRVAGRVFATTWSDYAVRIGPDQAPVESRPFMNAWLVLACEYGAPCGADTPRMLQACALQGHCAESFPEYLAQYASSPHDAALILQYSGLLRRAIETGDWSQLAIVRGLPNAGNRAFFVPGPR